MWKTPIHIVLVGTDFRHSTIGVLENLSRHLDRLMHSLAPLNGRDDALVVLATCNRLEIYAASKDVDVTSRALSRYFTLLDSRIKGRLYQFVDSQAVQHLLEVASGVDSLVIGEGQILLQVKHAKIIAGSQSLREVLEKLLRRAYRAGKRIRDEAGIVNKRSISTVALQLILEKAKPRPSILVIGAGKMAKSALDSIKKDQVGALYVAGRSPDRMKTLNKATVYALESIPSLLPKVEAVLVATSSTTYVLTRDMFDHTTRAKQLVIVDISLPRNVHPGIASLPNVELYNLSELSPYVEKNLSKDQERTIARLIQEEVGRYVSSLATLSLSPLVKSIRTWAESIRREELEEALRRLSGVKEKDAKVLDELSLSLVNRILHTPTARIRGFAGKSEFESREKVLRELFEIDA